MQIDIGKDIYSTQGTSFLHTMCGTVMYNRINTIESHRRVWQGEFQRTGEEEIGEEEGKREERGGAERRGNERRGEERRE